MPIFKRHNTLNHIHTGTSCTVTMYTMHTSKILAGIELHHFEVYSHLQSLDNDQIMDLGGALGLSYTRLQKMKHLPDNMVAAWLRKENYVNDDPTWNTLIKALEKVGQAGIAKAIGKNK